MIKTLTCPDYHWASKRWQRTEERFDVLNEINIGNLKLNWRTLPDSGSNAQNICNCRSRLNFSYLAAHHFTLAAKRGSQSESSLQQEEKKQMHTALCCSAFWVYSIVSSSACLFLCCKDTAFSSYNCNFWLLLFRVFRFQGNKMPVRKAPESL